MLPDQAKRKETLVMIPRDFYKNRPLLDHEFSDPHFDPATGLSSSELEANLQDIFTAKYDTVPNATLRAELFAYLYDHVQIEVNPKNLFAAKIDHQKMYSFAIGR